MGKERTNFSLVFNGIDRSNKDLLAEIKNPVIFNGRIDINEENIIYKPDKDFYKTLKSFPEGSTFNDVTSFVECQELELIPANTIFKKEVIFTNCSSLKSISNGVVFEGDALFADCENIQSISEDVVFNGSVEFFISGRHHSVARNKDSTYRFVNETASENIKTQLNKMKTDGKIKGNLYI